MEIWIFLLGVALGMGIACIVIIITFMKELLHVLDEKS